MFKLVTDNHTPPKKKLNKEQTDSDIHGRKRKERKEFDRTNNGEWDLLLVGHGAYEMKESCKNEGGRETMK